MNMVLDGMNSAHTPGFPDTGDQIQGRMFSKYPNTVFLFDILDNSPAGYQRHPGTEHHRGFANVLMLNGAVATFRPRDFVVDGNFDNPKPIWNHPQMYWGYRPDPK
jgi:hypothetical protein